MGCGPSKKQPVVPTVVEEPPRPRVAPRPPPPPPPPKKETPPPPPSPPVPDPNTPKEPEKQKNLELEFGNDFNNYDAIRDRTSLTKLSDVIGIENRESVPTLEIKPTGKTNMRGGREDINLQSTDMAPTNESLNLPKEIHIKNILNDDEKRDEFMADYEQLSKDPAFVRVSVAFLLDGPDGVGRRLYHFHVRKVIGTVRDIKKLILQDFGYEVKAQRLFRLFREVPDELIISNLKEFDPSAEVLIFLPVALPRSAPQVHYRPRVSELSIENIKKLNCSNISFNDFESYNTEDNLVWPPFKEWTQDAKDLTTAILVLKEKVGPMEDLESVEMSQLMTCEADFKRLVDQFEMTAKKIVSMIVQWKIEPVELDTLYGTGGRKFVAGGMLIRECRNWYVNRTSAGEGDLSYKIANHERCALEAARLLTSDITVPLCCIVDYFGVRYMALSLCPISGQTCTYGSSVQGLVIESHGDSERLAEKIAAGLNLKPHKVIEVASGKEKRLLLPYDTQIHRNPDTGEHYLISAPRMYPPDLHSAEEQDESDFVCNLLRSEFVEMYHEDQMKEGFEHFTWKSGGVECSECKKNIKEFEYFYFEKRTIETNKLVKQYYCCVSCHADLYERDGFQIPRNKMVRKVVPEKERAFFWLNKATGERIEDDFPIVKVPLNSDCLLAADERSGVPSGVLHEFAKSQDADKKQLKNASERLYQKLIKQYIAELSTLEEVPKTSKEITDSMHARGINVRYLGRLVEECSLNHVREIFVREILARGIKVLVRDGLSFLRDEPNGFTTSDVKRCVLHYLNEVLTTEAERESSKEVWDFVTELIKKKFRITLTRDIMGSIHFHGLLLAVAEKLNLKFEPDVRTLNLLSPNPLSMEDLLSISPKTKATPTLMFSILTTLERARRLDGVGKRSAWYVEGGPERAEASHLFKLAVAMAEQIYGEHAKMTGLIYKETAEHFESRFCEKGRPEYSIWNRCAIIPDNSLSADARFFYNKAAIAITASAGDYSPELADCYVGLARLTKTETSVVDSSVFKKDLSADEAVNFLLKAIAILEVSVGVDHPETAEIYTKLSLALQEKGRPAEASSYIRRAFSLFYNIFGGADEITLKTHEYLKAIETTIESGLDKVPLDSLAAEIEKIEFASQLNQ